MKFDAATVIPAVHPKSKSFQDLTGQRFERLQVLFFVGMSEESRHSNWLCACDCGGKIVLRGNTLKRGVTRSCGCLNMERITVHGHHARGRRTKVYRVWDAMIQRCSNSRHKYYPYYGGRGISVCERWLKFASFLIDMGPPDAGMTLDRIDNAKGYSPENCRWVSRLVQQNNLRSNVRVQFQGENLTLAELSRKVGMPYQKVRARISIYGWTVDKAVSLP
jgi:hypothetical protein